MKKPRLSLRDMSGTTLALTSLAVLGAAAVVSTPMWVWYRRKRKRTDALAATSPPGRASQPESPDALPSVPAEPPTAPVEPSPDTTAPGIAPPD